MSAIRIEGVGPIETLEIPVPEGGGVVVLRGRNGSGKTEALGSVAALLGGKAGRVDIRDGEISASVHGLGASLVVGRRSNRSGEIEVRALEGVDPSDLVDPGIKDPEAADAARIRALCVLAKATADPSLFSDLAAGLDAGEILSSDQLKAPDLPTLAARFKRAFESRARAHETESAGLLREAQGIRSSVESVDVAAPHEEAALARTTEDAVKDLAALEARRDAAEKAERAMASAKARFAAIPVVDVDALAMAEEQAEEGYTTARDLATDLRQRLAVAEQALKGAETEWHHARGARVAGERAAKERTELQRELGACVEPGPEPHTITTAKTRVLEARQIQEHGAVIRHAVAQLGKADDLRARSNDAGRKGEAFRVAAQWTEQVVTEAIANVAPRGLKVAGGRLVIHHEVRGKEVPFADLSQGERWRVALDVAIDAVGEHALLVIRQEAWEGLDRENRKAVAAHARSRTTVLMTAEATDGPLSAAVL